MRLFYADTTLNKIIEKRLSLFFYACTFLLFLINIQQFISYLLKIILSRFSALSLVKYNTKWY
jgi:hypothetical protein